MTRRRSTPDPAEPDWRSEFVDELGALGPEMGLSRATTRITAWMMVCDPPEQSAREIQDGVHLSAAAVSAATRELIVAGMLERVSRPRDRQVFYRLASGSWDAPLQAKLRALTRLRQVADRGIAAAGDHADYRLAEMRDAFAWFEEHLDRLIQQREHTRNAVTQ
jgi:DNA-binding transcriptional regulator GbsR (MarR family)